MRALVGFAVAVVIISSLAMQQPRRAAVVDASVGAVSPAMDREDRAAVIGGAVVDEDGAPIRGAEVRAFLSAAGQVSFGKATSNDAGQFEIWIEAPAFPPAGSAPADGWLFAMHENYVTQFAAFGGSDCEVSVVMATEGARVWGRVVEENGSPVPHAEVAALRALPNGAQTLMILESTRADEEGKFSCERLPAGRYLFRAWAGGKEFSTRCVREGTPVPHGAHRSDSLLEIRDGENASGVLLLPTAD